MNYSTIDIEKCLKLLDCTSLYPWVLLALGRKPQRERKNGAQLFYQHNGQSRRVCVCLWRNKTGLHMLSSPRKFPSYRPPPWLMVSKMVLLAFYSMHVSLMYGVPSPPHFIIFTKLFIFVKIQNSKGYSKYVDIWTGEICYKFWLLTWTSLINQLVHPVQGNGLGYRGWMGRIVKLASYKFHFIRVHDNMV